MNPPVPAAPGSAQAGERADAELVIPLVVEQAEVQKVREHIGSVRFRKVVHQDEQALPTIGYHEVVETVRVPVNRQVEASTPPHHRGDIYVIPVYEERLVRQLFLIEEIHVTQRRERVSSDEAVSLRREEVVIERLDPVTQQWVADSD